MAKTTRLTEILKSLNFNQSAGEVEPGWGPAPLMLVLIILFTVFLFILLQIYNSTLLLEGVEVEWKTI